MKKNRTVKKLALTAMFAAMIFVATAYLPRIPTMNGYVHLGDTFIYLAASMLPMPYSLICAGLGGFFADALTGYIIYAPGTLIVKMALTIAFSAKSKTLLSRRNIVAVGIGIPITVCGYFLYSMLVFDTAAAVGELLSNFGQAGVSGVLFVIIAVALDKLSFKKRLNLNPKTKQKAMAVIEDFSGHGRCSLAVALPIVSSVGIRCSCIPTAVFSNHSGYESYFFEDFTPKLSDFIGEWRKLKLSFDGIYTGFLGSAEQIEIVSSFIGEFFGGQVIVDPVMGDNGKIYDTYTDEMCSKMRLLVSHADIITPNITEACILTGKTYKNSGWSDSDISEIAKQLVTLGAKKVVITGIERNGKIDNFVKDGDSECFIGFRRTGNSRCGTGDVFASVIAADAVNGISLKRSVKRAAKYVAKCISLADELGVENNAGVPFEMLLKNLI